MTTQEQKQLISEYIAERACEIAKNGEINEFASIWVEDFGCTGEDCEIRVNFDGVGHRRSDDPQDYTADINYEGEADFFKGNGGDYIYSIPVIGRYINS